MSDITMSSVRKNLNNLSDPIDLRELNRQLEWIWRKLLGGITVRSVSSSFVSDVSSTAADTSKQIIVDEINARDTETTTLTTALANMMVAYIAVANIDYAKITDASVGQALIDKGAGGEFYFRKLAVTEGNMVSLSVGELLVKGSDGAFYAVGVDDSGNVTTTKKEVSNSDIGNNTIDGDQKLIENSITARTINAEDVFAATGNIIDLISQRIKTSYIFSSEGFVPALQSAVIYGTDGTLSLMASDLSNVKTVLRVLDDGVYITNPHGNNQVKIDGDSVDIGYPDSSAYASFDSEAISFGNPESGGYAKFKNDSITFGNYELRKSADGGLVFKMKEV